MNLNPKNRYLLDAGVFPLIFAGEPTVKPLVEEIASGAAEALVCEVNLAEFYAKTCEKKGMKTADIYYVRVRYQPNIVIITPDGEITKKAGWFKCKYRGKVSLADCYAAAVALTTKATLVTTDGNLHKMANSEKIPAKMIPF